MASVSSSRPRFSSSSSSHTFDREAPRDRHSSRRHQEHKHDRDNDPRFAKDKERHRHSRGRESSERSRHRDGDREKLRTDARAERPWHDEGEANRGVNSSEKPEFRARDGSPLSDGFSGNSGDNNSRHGGPRSPRWAEREPGELSSGSMSEEAAVAGQRSPYPSRPSQQPGAHADEGNEDSAGPSPKKRKYSSDDDDTLRTASAATSRWVSPPVSPESLPSLEPTSPPPPPSFPPPVLPTPKHNSSPVSLAVGEVKVSPPRSSRAKAHVGRKPISMFQPIRLDRVFTANASPQSPAKSSLGMQGGLGKDHNGSPFSDYNQTPGQLTHSPKMDDEDESIPSINIAASRWARDNEITENRKNTSSGTGKARKQRSLTVESDEDHCSSDREEGPRDSGYGMLPEPGENVREKHGTVSGVANGGSDMKEPNGDAMLDELYDREGEETEGEQEGDFPEGINKLEPDEEKSPSRPVTSPQGRIDMLQGCRSVDEFEKLNKIDEGTYGVVYRARNKKTGEIVALKKVKMEKERGGFPMTSLREINVLLSFNHPSVVDVKEVVVGSDLDHIFMVMEYMDHDMKVFMDTRKQPFSQSEVKCLMLQLFEGVKYLHDNWILHRDLKTSNLLLNNRGELKICDFGLARQYGSPLLTYTQTVVTLWYRAPELLLGAKKYSTAVDMWSLGCIMAELLTLEPIFMGKSQLDQLDKIFKILGTPEEDRWPDFVNLPHAKCTFTKQPFNRLREKFPPTSFAGQPILSESGFDLLKRLLTYDPAKRITAEEALKHEWFQEDPLPKPKELMPTFPAQHERARRTRRLTDPLEEQRKRELNRGELSMGGLFG